MDVCRLRSRRNLYVSIPVSANALQTQAFSRSTGNVFGRLENRTDIRYGSYFFERKDSYLISPYGRIFLILKKKLNQINDKKM